MDLPNPENTFLLIAVWNVLAAQMRLLPVGLQDRDWNLDFWR